MGARSTLNKKVREAIAKDLSLLSHDKQATALLRGIKTVEDAKQVSYACWGAVALRAALKTSLRGAHHATIDVEGVPYHRHVVRFTLADGRRRRWVRWSPGEPWVYEEIARELLNRFGLEGLKPKSCTITHACRSVPA